MLLFHLNLFHFYFIGKHTYLVFVQNNENIYTAAG